jgi:hypothetical protein
VFGFSQISKSVGATMKLLKLWTQMCTPCIHTQTHSYMKTQNNHLSKMSNMTSLVTAAQDRHYFWAIKPRTHHCTW